MPKPFYAEQAVVVDGETLILVANFKAIDATEREMGGLGYDVILDQFQDRDAEGKLTAPLALQIKVLWGLLRERHPEITLDQAASLMFGDVGLTIGVVVWDLLAAAFPTVEKEKGKNPPKPRGASKPS